MERPSHLTEAVVSPGGRGQVCWEPVAGFAPFPAPAEQPSGPSSESPALPAPGCGSRSESCLFREARVFPRVTLSRPPQISYQAAAHACFAEKGNLIWGVSPQKDKRINTPGSWGGWGGGSSVAPSCFLFGPSEFIRNSFCLVFSTAESDRE